MNNITLGNDLLEGETAVLPAMHRKFLAPKKEDRNRFHVSNKKIVAYEVHLYTQAATQGTHISMPMKDFYRLDVYELDKQATGESRVLSIAGITLGVGAIVAIIASAANSVSHIYTNPTPAPTQQQRHYSCVQSAGLQRQWCKQRFGGHFIQRRHICTAAPHGLPAFIFSSAWHGYPSPPNKKRPK